MEREAKTENSAGAETRDTSVTAWTRESFGASRFQILPVYLREAWTHTYILSMNLVLTASLHSKAEGKQFPLSSENMLLHGSRHSRKQPSSVAEVRVLEDD